MKQAIITLSAFLISMITLAAEPGTNFWPQTNNAGWSVNTDNELVYAGVANNSNSIIATTFGVLTSNAVGVNDYTGLTLKFDAFISADGAKNTTIVLSSNNVWGGKGIVIEANIYQIQALKNFAYPGTMLSSNAPYYQNTVVKPGAYNSFIIDVTAAGVITVTINDYVCPTTYTADVAILTANSPALRPAYFCTNDATFKLKNVEATKGGTTNKYFTYTPYTPPVAGLTGTYYIDGVNGSDAATGKSEVEAWRTFANVNKTTLEAGTKILLKKGSVWNQRLEIRGAGTASNWIQVDSYGTDLSKPKISLTNNKDDIGLLICDLDKTSGTRAQNISYIKIQNIEISNTRLGIYYRCVSGTENTGFVVDNVTFNNINCDPVMQAINNAIGVEATKAEITYQLQMQKGNLQTLNGNSDGGSNEYIFPAAIFVGGQTITNQTISGNHTTMLTEWQVSNCQFNEAIAGIMSVFYWPVANTDGANIWRQLVHKVKFYNCTSNGIVNGVLGLDCLDGGAEPDANGVMQANANGWGLIKNVSVTMGSAVTGRTYPNGTTGVIFSNCQNMLVDSCEFSNLLNQNNPDGCGFDFETHNNNVTIQNTKFINNDGHSILLMNGGNYGGNSNIIIQKNLVAQNVKNSNSTNEFLFSLDTDGNSNVKVRNNQVFMRKKNKFNADITFLPTRNYITASNNDLYYLDDALPEITVSFLGLPYIYKAGKFSVTAPQVSKLLLNNGATVTNSRTINVYNEYSLTNGTPAYYMVSENSNFTGANWILYTANFSFQLSAGKALKTIYFKTQNVKDISTLYSSSITLNLISPAAPTITSITSANNLQTVAFTSGPDGGSSITNYKYSTDGGSTFTACSPVQTTSPIIISSSSSNIQLKAVNAIGDGIASGTSSATDVSITSGEYIINQNGTIQSLTVNPGAKVTLNSGITFDVTGNLTIQSNATGTGTFVDAGGTLNVGGTTTVQQYLATARNWYVSSPVTNTLAATGFTYYKYDETGQNTNPVTPATAYWTSVAPGAVLLAGTGYVALPTTAPATLTFTSQAGGKLNTGDKTVTLTHSGATKTGFNLIGNPYPSHLTWTKAFVDANAAKIEPTIWYRTKSGTGNTGGWSTPTYNSHSGEALLGGSNIIPPMQAFWVKAVVAGNLTLNSTLTRSHNGSNPLKAPASKKSDRQRLRLQVTNGINIDEALLIFDANASNDYDAFDSPKMSSNSATYPEIYTQVGSEPVGINGLNSLVFNQEIPLGFTTGENNSFTLKASEISNFDSDTHIILKDKLNREFDLTSGLPYTFSSDITSSTDRFSIIFRSGAATTSLNNDLYKINAFSYRNERNQITVNYSGDFSNEVLLSVYNAVGQKLVTKLLKSNITTLDTQFKSGVYMVTVSEARKSVTNKVIIY